MKNLFLKLFKNPNRIIAILTGIVMVALFITIGIKNRKINRLSDENGLKSIELQTLKDSVAVFRARNGDLTYKLDVIEVSHRNLKEGLKTAGFDLKKVRNENIKLKNIVAALQMEIQSYGNISVPLIDTLEIIKTDTIKYQKFNYWTDNRLELVNGTIKNNNFDVENYYYNLKMNLIPTRERNKTIVSVQFDDKHTKVLSATSIVLEKDKKRFYERPLVVGIIGFITGALIVK